MSKHQLTARTAAVAATAVVVLVAGGCGGGGSTSSSTNASASYLAAVTRAAYTTDQVPGYKFEVTSTTKLAGKSVAVSGSGTISERGSQGSLDLEVQGTKLTEIIDKPYVYVKLPSGSSSVQAGGKPWIRANVNLLGESFGGSFGGSSADPTQTLSFLRSAGTVTRVGSETVRGAPATRYHAVIDLAHYAATVSPDQRAAATKYAEVFKRISGSATLPLDVWIDGQSRVSRIAFTVSLCSPQGGRLQESLNMELYGYGQQPVLKPPAASQVTDISDTLKAQLAKGLQQLSCH